MVGIKERGEIIIILIYNCLSHHCGRKCTDSGGLLMEI